MIAFVCSIFERQVARAKSFATDHSGVAAVEFGLIVPVLLVMMLGSIEISRAVVMHRRLDLATQMASDLIAREKQMTASDLAGVGDAVSTVWRPYDQTSLQMQVLQIRRASDLATQKPPGQTYVDWQYKLFSGALLNGYADGQNYPISDPNVPAKGAYTLIVNSTYTYTSLFGAQVVGITASMPWASTSNHTPRQACVDYKANNCTPVYE